MPSRGDTRAPAKQRCENIFGIIFFGTNPQKRTPPLCVFVSAAPRKAGRAATRKRQAVQETKKGSYVSVTA